MITRLRTSKDAKERIEALNRVLHLSSNAVLLRLAISKSIISPKAIDDDADAVVKDFGGFEITRATLFGGNESVYKYAMGIKKVDSDEKFFPTLTLKHIERGLKILEREYKLAGNKDRFYLNLVNKLDK